MKIIRTCGFVFLSLTAMSALGQQSSVTFSSADMKLTEAFRWAKDMALHYKGKVGDPVGPWYESALPPRDAFCMRDASHQCIGAEILGMGPENKNMFSLFTGHISESKDWCSYWEMNKWGKPAPEDYRNDKEFWYNLPANFDLLYASWRLYLWTGDRQYIDNPAFVNFSEKTVHQYIQKWVLQSDSLFSRPAHPNAPIPYHENDAFDRCRGLPSYSEGVPNLKMGADLVAALYRGLLTYSQICALKGQHITANHYKELAEVYEQQLNSQWWNPDKSQYYTYFSNDGHFGNDEGETFLLWFGALNNLNKRESTIAHINAAQRNMENTSYYPWLFYKYGHWDDARKYILYLSDPATARREYPEVSFGVIEGIVQGLMGVSADARSQTISTIYRSSVSETCSIKALPILGTTVNLTHSGPFKSDIHNVGKKNFKWRAQFNGDLKFAIVNNIKRKLSQSVDEMGHTLSFVDIVVVQGQSITVVAQP